VELRCEGDEPGGQFAKNRIIPKVKVSGRLEKRTPMNKKEDNIYNAEVEQEPSGRTRRRYAHEVKGGARAKRERSWLGDGKGGEEDLEESERGARLEVAPSRNEGGNDAFQGEP